MNPPLIMVAPTGARRGKSDHPALPITLDEIIATARECFSAGAEALHLHIRDDDGVHTLDAGRYRETLAELANAVPQMRVQITTEAVGRYSVAEQLDCLRRVQPSWASVSIREAAREEDLAERLYAMCMDNGTEVQHILYDEKDAHLLAEWSKRGIIKGELGVLLVLGRYRDANALKRGDIEAFVSTLPPVSHWMLCAFGEEEHRHLCQAAALGGNLRVGFENSLVDANGRSHRDNAASVRALKTALLSEPA